MSQVIPGQTIGIVGDTPRIKAMILAGKQYGYNLYCYHNHELGRFQQADKEFSGAYHDKAALLNFCEQVDVMFIVTPYIEIELLYLMSSKTQYFQSFELAEISQNLIVEKLFLENSQINVAPYSLISTIGELPMAIESIGFPARLEESKRKEEHYPTVTLLDNDLEKKVYDMIESSPCMLKAIVPVKRHFTISVVRDFDGQVEVLPITEDMYIGERIQFSTVSHRMNPDWKRELKRIAYKIMDSLSGFGIVTLQVILAKNGIFYVEKVTMEPVVQQDFNQRQLGISTNQLFIKIATGLPISLQEIDQEMLIVPIYPYMLGKMNVLNLLKPEWDFEYYTQTPRHEDEIIGVLRLTGDSHVDLINEIETCDLFYNENR